MKIMYILEDEDLEILKEVIGSYEKNTDSLTNTLEERVKEAGLMRIVMDIKSIFTTKKSIRTLQKTFEDSITVLLNKVDDNSKEVLKDMLDLHIEGGINVDKKYLI